MCKNEERIGKLFVEWTAKLDDFADAIEYIDDGSINNICEQYKFTTIELIRAQQELIEKLMNEKPFSITELGVAFPGEPADGSNVTTDEEIARA